MDMGNLSGFAMCPPPPHSQAREHIHRLVAIRLDGLAQKYNIRVPLKGNSSKQGNPHKG
jgi:hypothetical protein